MKSGAIAATFNIVPRHVLGGPGHLLSSIRLNICFIGTGTQGLRILMNILPRKEIYVSSVCDANRDSQDYVEWYKNELRDKIRLFLGYPEWGKKDIGCRAGREVGRQLVDAFYSMLAERPV